MRLFALGLAISMITTRLACGESPKNQPTDVNAAAAKDGASPSTVQSAAQEFIAQLQKEKFDEAAKRFDATMRKALPAAQLEAVWRATIQANGAFQKAEPSHANHVGVWDVVDTPCVFEKSNIVVRMSFDKQWQVGGLFFLPATKRDLTKGDGPEVQLKTATGTMFGSLDLPASKGPWPVALIIAGSGPTDRDGNQPLMKNDSLRMLGKALAAQGVAALRYDKRGTGKSAAAGAVEEKLRFENYIDDAAGWVKQLRGDRRFNKIVILGHSEGSLIGIMVAKREPINALISVAGSGRELAAMLRDQLKRNLPAEQFQQSSHIVDELLAGRKVDDVPPELTSLFRPSVQPYLMNWLKYDPAKEIASLAIPILVVQGTTDLQVSIDDAKLLAAANKKAHLAKIENMNHVLKSASVALLPAQVNTYSDPSLPLAPHLMDQIGSFLQANQIGQPASDSR